MDDKDLMIQRMRREMARLSNKVAEAAAEACLICMKSGEIRDCKDCRIHKLREEMEK